MAGREAVTGTVRGGRTFEVHAGACVRSHAARVPALRSHAVTLEGESAAVHHRVIKRCDGNVAVEQGGLGADVERVQPDGTFDGEAGVVGNEDALRGLPLELRARQAEGGGGGRGVCAVALHIHV